MHRLEFGAEALSQARAVLPHMFCVDRVGLVDLEIWLIREQLGRQLLFGSLGETLDRLTYVRLPTARKFIDNIAFLEHW